MADQSSDSLKITGSFGEVVGAGPFGEKGSVNIDLATGAIEQSYQIVAFDLSAKINYSDESGLKIAIGQGNITGLVAGVSEFAGIQIYPTLAAKVEASVTTPVGGMALKY